MGRAAAGRLALAALLVLMAAASAAPGPLTTCENDCNGHGSCTESTRTCVCYEGWGASTDVSVYKAPDCSLRAWRRCAVRPRPTRARAPT